MAGGPGAIHNPTFGGSAPRSSAMQSMVRLSRGLLLHAPAATLLVLALTFGLILTSSISLVMLVPLLGVAGLDIGEGGVGHIAELVIGVLDTIGLSLHVSTVMGAYVMIVVCSAAIDRVHAVRTIALYQSYVMALRVRVYEGIARCRWVDVMRAPSSSFVHTLTQEIERVAGAVSGTLGLLVNSVMTAVYFALALFVSPGTTLLVLACGALLMGLLVPKTRLGRERGAAVSDAYEALYGTISEHLAGLRITRSHGVEPVHSASFRQRTHAAARAQADVVRNQADVAFWLKVGSAVTMAGVFSVALLVFELSLASILLLLYLFARLVPSLTGLQRKVQQVLGQLAAVDRVEAQLAWLAEHAEPMSEAGQLGSDADLRDVLRLEGVSFAYAGADSGAAEVGEAVLHAVDIEVHAGQTTAIVGPSGGGKSTVADLVVGLLTPTSGRVSVDGVPLEGPRLKGWRRRIGYVNQDTFLFHDTIRANLELVRPEASETELHEALEAAAASFVHALPRRLDTVVGDRGVRLSGGERQRIALARAILRRPVLLVLDEATSALDPTNERLIQTAIDRIAGRQTILVIAHRLATVRSADAIYVIEDGRVVESGTWDELVGRPQGRFRALCRAQGLLGDEGIALLPTVSTS